MKDKTFIDQSVFCVNRIDKRSKFDRAKNMKKTLSSYETTKRILNLINNLTASFNPTI